MSSQVDYWKAMRAKNEELLAKKSPDGQNLQASRQSQPHRVNNQPQPHQANNQSERFQHSNASSGRPGERYRSKAGRANAPHGGYHQGHEEFASRYSNASASNHKVGNASNQQTRRPLAPYSWQRAEMRSSARPQTEDRPARDGRVLRSQDYLLRRDDEIGERPSRDWGSATGKPPLRNEPSSFGERSLGGQRSGFNERPMEGQWPAREQRLADDQRSAREQQPQNGQRIPNHRRPSSCQPEGRQIEGRRPRGSRSGNGAPHEAHPSWRQGEVESVPAKPSAKKPEQKPPRDARKLGKSYLPGLDGLRCIAVMAVLLYHISPNQFVGGYIGVDLFFVISGFLITYRNLQNIQNPEKNFTLKNFWLRRARRLIPALVLCVLVCVPLGAIIYPDILVGAFRQVAGALTYSSNWVEIIHGSNYFDQANPQLFKNFWSLAVEEQFYIIWPPLMLLLLSRKLRHSQLVTIVATIAVLSMVLMGVLADPNNYTRVYYGTDTHCFGLAMGIIFAFIWNKEKGSLSKEWLSSQRWTAGLAPVGLIGFVAITFLVTDTSAFAYPFGLGLGSLFSLFLVAGVIVKPHSLFTRVMELAPLRWIGVRSYGIYLWHWPMLVFGRILIPTALGTPQNVAVDVLFALISFIAADLSYRFVEEPLRKDGFIKFFEKLVDRVREGIVGRAQAIACVVLIVATIVAVATAPEKTQLQMQIEAQQAQQEQQMQEAQQNQANSGDSTQDPSAIPNYDEAQMTGVPDGSTITAIGDSLISGDSIGFEEEFDGINFLAEPSRQWAQGLEVVKVGVEQGMIRQNVILDFGTNGGVKDENVVREVIDTLGPNRRILLYNIYSPSSFVDSSNEVYAKIADEYPNVYLVDWNFVAKNHPEYLNSDRTHTTIDGQNAFVGAAKEVFSKS